MITVGHRITKSCTGRSYIFCNESGYQTPKLDTRASIFENGKILLVRENNGKWSLPGGWCDVNVSVGENTVKEVKEESGLDVVADRILKQQNMVISKRIIYQSLQQRRIMRNKLKCVLMHTIQMNGKRYLINKLPIFRAEVT